MCSFAQPTLTISLMFFFNYLLWFIPDLTVSFISGMLHILSVLENCMCEYAVFMDSITMIVDSSHDINW